MFSLTSSSTTLGQCTPAASATKTAAQSELGRNFCASSEESDPSLTLDLGTAKQIVYIVVYNRRDCCKQRLEDYI